MLSIFRMISGLNSGHSLDISSQISAGVFHTVFHTKRCLQTCMFFSSISRHNRQFPQNVCFAENRETDNLQTPTADKIFSLPHFLLNRHFCAQNQAGDSALPRPDTPLSKLGTSWPVSLRTKIFGLMMRKRRVNLGWILTRKRCSGKCGNLKNLYFLSAKCIFLQMCLLLSYFSAGCRKTGNFPPIVCFWKYTSTKPDAIRTVVLVLEIERKTRDVYASSAK